MSTLRSLKIFFFQVTRSSTVSISLCLYIYFPRVFLSALLIFNKNFFYKLLPQRFPLFTFLLSPLLSRIHIYTHTQSFGAVIISVFSLPSSSTSSSCSSNSPGLSSSLKSSSNTLFQVFDTLRAPIISIIINVWLRQRPVMATTQTQRNVYTFRRRIKK